MAVGATYGAMLQRAVVWAWVTTLRVWLVQVMWCCGALCIEHKAIEPHGKAMHGSMDSVLGLPKQLLARLLRAAGYKGTILTGS